MNPTIHDIFQGILDGQKEMVEMKVEAALKAGESPKTILDEGMVNAMTEVGRRFESGEYFVPEMLISARAMKAGMVLIKPKLIEAKIKSIGRVAIGTVRGDLHDIGKNLVGMMLEGAGFEVLDLGTDVAPEAFAAVADEVDLIALSALLTTTMLAMKDTVDALIALKKRSKVKVIVGGAPLTEDFAKQIGADGYAPDASRAAVVAKSLIT